jgi:hypothetical protein
MELLLNLAWLLLALPGYWLWRNGEPQRAARRVTALQGLLALSCGLVLLFPVISATDDLHAVRAEMEESSASKRAVRQAGGENNYSWANGWQGPSALLASGVLLPAAESGPFPVIFARSIPLTAAFVLHVGRGPPVDLRG